MATRNNILETPPMLGKCAHERQQANALTALTLCLESAWSRPRRSRRSVPPGPSFMAASTTEMETMNAGSRSLAARHCSGHSPCSSWPCWRRPARRGVRRVTVARCREPAPRLPHTHRPPRLREVATSPPRTIGLPSACVDCMRLHGVLNSRPISKGALNVNSQTDGKGGSPVSSGVNRNSPQYPRTRSGSARARHGRGRPVRSGARRSDRTTSGAPGEHPM